jgi:hypothetical protein
LKKNFLSYLREISMESIKENENENAIETIIEISETKSDHPTQSHNWE